MLRKNKLIIDTNLWISWLIGNKRTPLSKLLADKTIELYSCTDQILELFEVLERDKFRKHFRNEDLPEFKLFFVNAVIIVPVNIKIKVSRDSKDDYLLALAKTVNANYLLTGDKDLLILKKFENTRISTLQEYFAS